MKHIFTTLIIFFSLSASFAQAPQGIPYQSAIRNSSGSILSNQSVSLRFSIHDSTTTGAIVYQETHTAITNNQGIVNLNIGQGSPSTGIFSSINWGGNTKFLQIEMNLSGGTSYTDLGTQQMMSVPFALFSKTAGELKPKGSNSNTLIYTADGF